MTRSICASVLVLGSLVCAACGGSNTPANDPSDVNGGSTTNPSTATGPGETNQSVPGSGTMGTDPTTADTGSGSSSSGTGSGAGTNSGEGNGASQTAPTGPNGAGAGVH